MSSVAASAAAVALYYWWRGGPRSSLFCGSQQAAPPGRSQAAAPSSRLDHAPNTWIEALEVFKEVFRLMYTETLGRWHTVDLFVGLAYLSNKEQAAYAASDIAASGAVVNLKGPLEDCWALKAELLEIRRYMLYCQGLKFKKPEVQARFWMETARITPDQILLQEATAGLLRPAYVIIRDDVLGKVVLAIRGTKSMKDLFTSLTGATKPHHIVTADGVVLGYSHLGMLAAARWLQRQVTPLLKQALQEAGPDYEVRIAGHSMGAGTAVMLTMMLRDMEPALAHVKCVAVACPACMTEELARSCRGFVTSVVNGTDVVPTFCAASVEALREDVTASSWFAEFQSDLRGSLGRVLSGSVRGLGSATTWTARTLLSPAALPLSSCYTSTVAPLRLAPPPAAGGGAASGMAQPLLEDGEGLGGGRGSGEELPPASPMAAPPPQQGTTPRAQPPSASQSMPQLSAPPLPGDLTGSSSMDRRSPTAAPAPPRWSYSWGVGSTTSSAPAQPLTPSAGTGQPAGQGISARVMNLIPSPLSLSRLLGGWTSGAASGPGTAAAPPSAQPMPPPPPPLPAAAPPEPFQGSMQAPVPADPFAQPLAGPSNHPGGWLMSAVFAACMAPRRNAGVSSGGRHSRKPSVAALGVVSGPPSMVPSPAESTLPPNEVPLLDPGLEVGSGDGEESEESDEELLGDTDIAGGPSGLQGADVAATRLPSAALQGRLTAPDSLNQQLQAGITAVVAAVTNDAEDWAEGQLPGTDGFEQYAERGMTGAWGEAGLPGERLASITGGSGPASGPALPPAAGQVPGPWLQPGMVEINVDGFLVQTAAGGGTAGAGGTSQGTGDSSGSTASSVPLQPAAPPAAGPVPPARPLHRKLHPAGRILHFVPYHALLPERQASGDAPTGPPPVSPDGAPQDGAAAAGAPSRAGQWVLLEVEDPSAYCRVKLCRTMVMDHFVSSYLVALDSVVAQIDDTIAQRTEPVMSV